MAVKIYNFQWSDAGRDRRQRNDCSVRSLALACSLSYNEAYLLMQSAGRRQNGGVTCQQLEQAIPFKWSRHLYKATPELFMGSHPTGRYILNLREHFSAVVDGTMLDTNSYFGKLIYSYYTIHGPQETQQPTK